VRDRATPNEEMILSNWHVLATYWGAPRGQPILQPGLYDGGSGADVIATLERDAMSANLDAAVATLNGSRGLSNDQLGIGPVKGVGSATIDMEVEKSGRTSHVTYGRVTGVGGIQRLYYGWLERVIRDVVTIEPLAPEDPPVSQGGDSGSWWVDSATRRAIGLHFAGCDDPSRALALDMQEVLNALNVEIPPAL
jgi:endonuclease G